MFIQSTPVRWLVSRGGLIVSLAALVALAGCGSTGGGTTGGGTTSVAATATSAPAATATSAVPANATTIKITGASGAYSFNPASVTITVGSTVVWQNNTNVPHTATNDSGAAFTWDSGTINSGGGSFSQVFTKAGTFAYHCNFHPFMHGTIVVTG